MRSSRGLGTHVFVVVLALCAWAPAQSEGFQKERAKARAELVQRMLGLAKWCIEKEIFQSRDDVWKQVIALDADNLEAHKGLRYARNPDGSWKEPAARPAKDRNPDALAELPKRRAEMVTPLRDRLLDLLDQEKADAALRRSVYDEILALDPDDARVRGLLGEVKVGHVWVLPETAQAAERRSEIRTFAQQSLANAPKPAPDAARPEEAALVASWKVALKTPTVRVLGTGEDAECEKLAQTCHAATVLFASALGEQPKLPPGFTIYFLANPAEKDGFLEKLPGSKPEEKTFLKNLIGGGLPGTVHMGLWGGDAKKRLDLALRNVFAHAVRETWGIGARHGWIWEGLGLYLTNEIAGTHLTWFISPGVGEDATTSALRKRMLAGDWMNEAARLFEGNPPALAEVLKKEASAMGPKDLLVGYALVAWILEARASDAAEIFRRAGKVSGESSGQVVEAVVSMKLPEVEARLKRWLAESWPKKAEEAKKPEEPKKPGKG